MKNSTNLYHTYYYIKGLGVSISLKQFIRLEIAAATHAETMHHILFFGYDFIHTNKDGEEVDFKELYFSLN